MDEDKIIRFPTHRVSAGPNDRGFSKLYTLRVTLIEGLVTDYTRDKIWRTIEMRGDQTLHALHVAIFDSFDRFDEHLYEFSFGRKPFDRSGKRYASYTYDGGPYEGSLNADKATIDSLGLIKGQTFHYRFDFGDKWIHKIKVVSVGDVPNGVRFPRITEKKGESPPQYPDVDDAVEDDFLGDETDEGEASLYPYLDMARQVADEMLVQIKREWRAELERKTMDPNVRLEAALKKLPGIWLQAMCKSVGCSDYRRSKERVQALVEHLLEKEFLATIWKKLPEPSRRVLMWVLVNKQGCALLRSLSRKFGPDEDNSWFWNEGDTPTTPLGLLQLYGLIFVGTTKIDGKRQKSAIVPVELRAGLQSLAEAPDAFKNAPPMPEPRDESIVLSDQDVEEALAHALFGELTQEPPDELDLEVFLTRIPFRQDSEQFYCNAADEISEHSDDFQPDQIRALLNRMIQSERVRVRHKAYVLGASVFGADFAKAALEDKSKTISTWAYELLNPRQGKLF